MLAKLNHYGINGDVNQWIASFLMERHQRVVIDGTASEHVDVDSGVPQGTVLGPLLFLLYINYLRYVVSSHVRLFADDCLLYRPIKTKQDEIALQEDLTQLAAWADRWGMRFNADKCYTMSISPKDSDVPLYHLGGTVLELVTESKYLGITIQDNLQWSTHLSSTVAKANRTLGFIRRNLKHCPQKLKELAYFSLVRSKLEYASSVWDPYLVKDKKLIESTQRRAARFVTNNHARSASVSNMLDNLGWKTLEARRQEGRINMFSKIVSGKIAINKDIYLTENTNRTRKVNSVKYRLITTKTTVFKNSFFPRTIPEWNQTPDSVADAIAAVRVT